MFFRDTLPLLVCCMVIYLKYVNKSRDQCIGCLSLVVIMEGGGVAIVCWPMPSTEFKFEYRKDKDRREGKGCRYRRSWMLH